MISATMARLYSAEPRTSEAGSLAAAAAAPAALNASSLGCWPASAASADGAANGDAESPVTPIPARLIVPAASRITIAHTPTVAKSPTRRSSLV